MPVHTNSIGDFSFLEMRGSPFLRQQDLEIIERDGVNGSGVRRLGLRGKPFQLETTNYLHDFATALAAMDAYKEAVGDDPVPLIRHSENEGNFIVLGVAERDCYAIFSAIGGIVSVDNPLPHEVCQIVSWTLLG
jgi:hypothetical protein